MSVLSKKLSKEWELFRFSGGRPHREQNDDITLLPGCHHHRLLLTNQSEGVGHAPLVLALADLGGTHRGLHGSEGDALIVRHSTVGTMGRELEIRGRDSDTKHTK